MYIPPQLRSKEWHRFFAGIILGLIAGYLLFIFIHGKLHESYTQENIELNSELIELEAKYEGLLSNEGEPEDKDNNLLKVEEITVHYTNAKKLQVDLLTQHQLSSLVKQQLDSIPGKEIKDAASQTDLIIAAIENKKFVVEDFTYQLIVRQLIVGPTLKLKLDIGLEN